MRIKDDGKKRIIVQRCKHGNEYFDASTQAAADASFLKMFRDNREYGFYNYVAERPAELEKKIAEMEAQTTPLPEGLPAAHYKLAEEALKKLTRTKRELADAVEQAALLERADAGDVESVKEFLRNREHGEYEGFSIETLR